MTEGFPEALNAEALSGFFDHVRTLAREQGHARLVAQIYAEAFVAVCIGYNQQLAVRGDLDPAPFIRALMAILEG